MGGAVGVVELGVRLFELGIRALRHMELPRRAEPHLHALTERLRHLFSAMRQGGTFGVEDIAWFNGGLFDDDDVVEPLDVGAPEGPATEQARLLLARAARIVLANALTLLGISAPDRM